MKSKKFQSVSAKYFKVPVHLFTFAFLLAVAGCAVPQVPSRVIYEDPVNFVRLEPDPFFLPEWPPSANSHPALISPGEMGDILKGFIVREHRPWLLVKILGEAPWEPAFRDEEIALLVPRLSEALAQAKPDERVTYYLSQPQTSIKREITSGGIYVKDNQLHFILGNRRIIYGIPAYGMVYDRRYPMRPTAAKGFDIRFDQTTAVVTEESSIWDQLLGWEKDEMVIDLRKLVPSPSLAFSQLPLGRVRATSDCVTSTLIALSSPVCATSEFQPVLYYL